MANIITFSLSTEQLSAWSNTELIEQVHIFHDELHCNDNAQNSILTDTMIEIYDELLHECARRLETLTN